MAELLVNKLRLQVVRMLFLLLMLGFTACAPTQKVHKRYFWPPGSPTPKIEYINFYQTDRDIHRGDEHWLETAIFGQELPRLMLVRPYAIAVQGHRTFVADQGQVQVWDFEKHTIRKLKTANGNDFSFDLAAGIATDAQGRVYATDSLKKEIDIFGPDEHLRAIIRDSHLTRPTGIAVDAARQRIYVTDTGNHQLVVFNVDGTWLQNIGKRGVGQVEFNFPLDVDLDRDGNLYVLDSMNARVQVLSPAGDFIRQFGERGTAIGSFMIPKGIAVSPSGLVYVTDSLAHRFVVFNLKGEFLTTIGGEHAMSGTQVLPGGLYLPEGIACGDDDSIWVVDSLNRMFHQYQYLTDAYLAQHPIRPEQLPDPEDFMPSAEQFRTKSK